MFQGLAGPVPPDLREGTVSSYSQSAEYERVLDLLREQGWDVRVTRVGHFQCRPPDKSKPLVHGAISGDRRGLSNFKSELRRSGAKI